MCMCGEGMVICDRIIIVDFDLIPVSFVQVLYISFLKFWKHKSFFIREDYE